MKNILRNFFFYIILSAHLILSGQTNSTCPLVILINDLSTSNAEFKDVVQDSKGFNAWQILNKEAPTLRTNIASLELVSNNLDEINKAGGYLKWKAGDEARKVLDDLVLAMKADFPSTWKFNKIGDDAFEVLDGAGKKWGTVYKDKIVCPARTQIGTAGNPILNKAVLVKNMSYEVDGIIYKTEELGRVLTTTADLDDIARVRLGNQQIRAVDVKDGVRGVDQGGHIVGSRFFGPGEQINLYPQSAKLNQGAWKTMENSWADAMVAGKDVKIEVEAVFSGASKRPDSFKVKYTIDGQPFQENFVNQ